MKRLAGDTCMQLTRFFSIVALTILLIGGIHIPVYAYAGIETAACPTCGEFAIAEVISSRTCTEAERLQITCVNQRCSSVGRPITVTSGVPLGHQWMTDRETAATCTEGGSQDRYCTRCGEQNRVTTAALGHAYQTRVESEATCTAAGRAVDTCSRCGKSQSKTIAALGHNYDKKTTEPTCTEDGKTVSTCSRCGDSKTEVLPALGHDMETHVVSETTCTEAGVTIHTCKRCGESEEEREEAFGHLYISEVTQNASCTEAGSRHSRCARCKEETDEIIAALGHQFTEEWTVRKEAGLLEDGIEYRSCVREDAEEERVIPRKLSGTTAAVTGAAAIAALGGLGYGLMKLLKARKAAEALGKGIGGIGYTLDNRKIVMCMEETPYNRSLIDTFLGKPYLKITETNREEFISVVERIEPDLVVLGVESMEDLNGIEARILEAKAAGKKGVSDDTEAAEGTSGEKSGTYALIAAPAVMESGTQLLEDLKARGVIDTYMDQMRSTLIVLVHLVLPMYKPDLRSDEGIALIGSVGDALGIPGVSLLMNAILTKHDIEDRRGNDDRALSENAAIIGDIASILGLGVVENIANLIAQEDVIKDTVEKQKRKG